MVGEKGRGGKLDCDLERISGRGMRGQGLVVSGEVLDCLVSTGLVLENSLYSGFFHYLHFLLHVGQLLPSPEVSKTVPRQNPLHCLPCSCIGCQAVL